MDADARLLIVLGGCIAPVAVWLLVPLVDAMRQVYAIWRLLIEAMAWGVIVDGLVHGWVEGNCNPFDAEGL